MKISKKLRIDACKCILNTTKYKIKLELSYRRNHMGSGFCNMGKMLNKCKQIYKRIEEIKNED